jgi:hypothetical protein
MGVSRIHLMHSEITARFLADCFQIVMSGRGVRQKSVWSNNFKNLKKWRECNRESLAACRGKLEIWWVEHEKVSVIFVRSLPV